MRFNVEVSGRYLTLVPRPPRSVEYKLEDVLRFEDVEFGGTVFYQEGTTFVGFAEEVRTLLGEMGHTCAEVTLPSLPKKAFRAKFTGEYRPFQKEAADAAYKKRFGIIQLPMGSGKTVIMADIVCRFGLRTLVLCEDQAPFDQMVGAFQKFTNIGEVGKIQTKNYSLQNVSVGMRQTLMSRIAAGDEELIHWLRNVQVVVTDEFHNSAADSYIKLFYEFFHDIYASIGVTGTPFRADGKDVWLTALGGPVIYAQNYRSSIDVGNVCPMTVIVESCPVRKNYGYAEKYTAPQAKKRYWYQCVYEDYIVNNVKRNQQYADMAKRFMEAGTSCAIIVSRKAHIEELCKLLPNAVPVFGETKKSERLVIWEKLKRHEVMCVVTTLMDEATDIPSLGAVLLASGGKSEVRLLQRLRSIRTFAGEVEGGWYEKERGFVYTTEDYADYVGGHSRRNIALLQSYIEGHPDNVWYDLRRK